MSSESGQVLTWHQACLACSVCQANINLDNVVFKEKLFCKTCYLDAILNKCEQCCKVRRCLTQLGLVFHTHFQSKKLLQNSRGFRKKFYYPPNVAANHWGWVHLPRKILARHLLRLRHLPDRVHRWQISQPERTEAL